MRHFRGRTLAGLILVLAFWTAAACAGQTLLAREGRAILDLAGLLDPADSDAIREQLGALHRDQGIDGVVVTLPSLADYGGVEIEPLARQLFDHWGIDDAVSNDGFLVLLAREERAIRVELGGAYGHRYDAAIEDVIASRSLPRFRTGDYAAGLRDTLTGVAEALTGPRPATDWLQGIEAWAERHPLLAWMLGVFGGAALLRGGWVGLRDLLRARAPRCRRCGARMTRLRGVRADEHLNDARKLERSLRSSVYYVWICRQCQNVDFVRYPGPSRKWLRCEGCGYHTLAESSVALREASYTREGLGKRTRHCEHCGLDTSEEFAIPVRRREDDDDTKGSSSSGGSRGGRSGRGSSGGGGATGRW